MLLWNSVGGRVIIGKYDEDALVDTSQGATARKAEEAVFDFTFCGFDAVVNENAALSSGKSSNVTDNCSSGDFVGDFVSIKTACDDAEVASGKPDCCTSTHMLLGTWGSWEMPSTWSGSCVPSDMLDD